MTEHVGPDTGFKLRPLIQDVLGASEATEPDELALEVLGRIAEYDRETALFQALKALVRESWRPKFIPAPRPVAGPTPVRTPQNPPPDRDGRQWMERDAADEKPRATSWSEVRAQRPPDETAVAEHRVTMDPDFVRYVREHDEANGSASNDDGPDPAPGLAELRQQPRPYRQQPAARPSFVPPRRPSSPPPPPRPQASPRVAAIREAWRKTLRQRIAVETGHKFFGDCTVIDLEYAADQREQHAKRTQARADELRRLVEVMREHDVSTLKDLPVEVLAGLESSLETAAA